MLVRIGGRMGGATDSPDSTLAAWPYLQGRKAAGHAHAHAHTLMPHTQRSYPPDGHPMISLILRQF